MNVLGLDIGSSSIKAAILRKDRIVGDAVRVGFPTRYHGERAEVEPDELLRAVARAIHRIGAPAKRVEAIALAVMSPAWVAMDHEGRAITPIVTHQDRRSRQIALELEARLGRKKYLRLAGNRPFPGGISCTTWAWFLKHEPAVMKKADLCGHLNTFLHRQITHTRVIDPSNASFTGFYCTVDQSGWCDELIDAVGIKRHRLPQIIGSDGIGGLVTREASRRFGLTHGTPMLAGMVDTGAAMLLSGAESGNLTNVSGSTDVLALCTERAAPHDRLLTRALGIGRKWLSVATLAAAGSTFEWAHQQLFPDFSEKRFWKMVRELARIPGATSVTFEPYLAGDRTSIEQRRGAFNGLTLSTTREELLKAIIESLASASAARLDLLKQTGQTIRRRVLVSGGASATAQILRRDWPGKWAFDEQPDATLRGLGKLLPA